MTVFTVEVVFDFVCAWCYIGKRKLDRAIALYQKTYPGGKNDVFAITWRPYYLDYNPSTHSIDKSLLAETKLSGMSPERRAALTQRMEQIGRFVGINFKWGGKIGPDTRDAHHLVRIGCAENPETAEILVEKLFEAYHELERDISELEVLLDIAAGAGLESAEVEGLIRSGAGLNEVDEDEKRGREISGGSGVPMFIIQGVHVLEGAQDASDFYEAFVQVKETGTSAS
ncbi:dsba-like thioredoxin domain-containing protein [Colletotrichum incanum]|uniref:Dsba-like thioredoxin domain-containing protein n=1 Tax=Colletotrichum incanum TaxID=1573173 RepID=A0A162PTB7_COLIC|nr:dsba-like thioredoxin domain-containing protein [Colletotrichum incanum]OHW98197.1 dsba-like thioredoxin domain-containing protein [Colletotrichum incanum]